MVTEGREEGPDEGEPWRLAASRRRRRSSNDEAQHVKLSALAKKLNHYFLGDTREGNCAFEMMSTRWWVDRPYRQLIRPRNDVFERWLDNEVADKNIFLPDIGLFEGCLFT